MYSRLQRNSLKMALYAIIGLTVVTICILFNPGSAALASGPETAGSAYSWVTIFMIVMGIPIFLKYISSMITVLQEASASYTETEDEEENIAYFASPFWGAAVAGVIAALVIWSYGVSHIFLYLGPILCLASPVAIIYCMSQDIQSFRRMHPSSNSLGEDVIAQTAER
ncbi:hypothetical protein [Leptolyngbya sp. KIOST-1]|uniref:hypothetical protein n=1 Tax=Leptolyngbya sp. KIOST-1 TaxID=1229172 RepID=UPI0012E05E7B|nr:hypothetical protein [Leptolyngbya sp. KIOST-1]